MKDCIYETLIPGDPTTVQLTEYSLELLDHSVDAVSIDPDSREFSARLINGVAGGCAFQAFEEFQLETYETVCERLSDNLTGVVQARFCERFYSAIKISEDFKERKKI
ncbi:MAG TPA: hypothetical protein VFN31_03120 [Candidatus Saccharimonadales bacterium]|nr:hypothetical protein [Candidatus Saccharimonadales bacterium]